MKSYFEKFGVVLGVRGIDDELKPGETNRGYCFVTLENAEMAFRILEHGEHLMKGRKLNVQPTKTKFSGKPPNPENVRRRQMERDDRRNRTPYARAPRGGGGYPPHNFRPPPPPPSGFPPYYPPEQAPFPPPPNSNQLPQEGHSFPPYPGNYYPPPPTSGVRHPPPEVVNGHYSFAPHPPPPPAHPQGPDAQFYPKPQSDYGDLGYF